MSAKTVAQQVSSEEPALKPPVLDDHANDMLEVILSENGMIQECSMACMTYLKCSPSELLWQHISVLLPQFAVMPLMQGGQINPRLRFLSHIGNQFELIGKGGVRFLSEVFFNDVEGQGRHYLHLVIRPVRSLSALPA